MAGHVKSEPKMMQNTKIIGGIECDFVTETSEIKYPILFILHGRQQSKHQFLKDYNNFISKIINLKFTVVLFDLRNHGSRLLDEQQNRQKTNTNHALDMYSNEYGTSLDLMQLSTIIPLYFQVEIFGVLGYSMGAHIALMTVPRFKFKVCVSIVGCGDYYKLMKYRNQELGLKLKELVLREDPVNQPEKFKDTKLLMVFGNRDSLVPQCCNEQFEKQLGSNWESKIFEAGHEFNSEMQDYVLNWLQNI